jgi:hypothetical protein
VRSSSHWLVAAATAAWVVGCAVAGNEELMPEVDPTVPGLDAGYDPSAPGKDGGSSKPSGPEMQPPPSGSDAAADTGSPPPAGTPKAGQGEVLVSEVMYDPFGTEPAAEWFEVTNVASSARSISGLVITDGAGRTHTIGAGVVITPGQYVVLARVKSAATAAKVPPSVIVYEYGAGLPDNAGIQLANGTTGGLTLRDGAVVVAQADYGGWYSQSGGSSVQLKTLTFAASGSSASWCLSLNPWTAGSDKGTPGGADDCP